MNQHPTKDCGTETEERMSPLVDDAPVFEEVKLFATALIQGGDAESPGAE